MDLILDLSHTRLGASGLGPLTHLPFLTELRLVGVSLDASIVPLVRRLPSLRTLDVQGTSLPAPALRALASARVTILADAPKVRER